MSTPAGAQQGTTSEHVIAGQFLSGITNVHVTGGGVTATLADFIHPIQGKELNDLRILVDELTAKKAVVRKDFKALENFRSFKNAKSIKKDSAEEDKEIEALKKKYADATWTAEDEKQLDEARRRISGRRAPARQPRHLRTGRLQHHGGAPTPSQASANSASSPPGGISNPLVFHVGQMQEFSEPASKSIAQQVSAVCPDGLRPEHEAQNSDVGDAARGRQWPDPARRGGPVPLQRHKGPEARHRRLCAATHPLHL